MSRTGRPAGVVAAGTAGAAGRTASLVPAAGKAPGGHLGVKLWCSAVLWALRWHAGGVGSAVSPQSALNPAAHRGGQPLPQGGHVVPPPPERSRARPQRCRCLCCRPVTNAQHCDRHLGRPSTGPGGLQASPDRTANSNISQQYPLAVSLSDLILPPARTAYERFSSHRKVTVFLLETSSLSPLKKEGQGREKVCVQGGFTEFVGQTWKFIFFFFLTLYPLVVVACKKVSSNLKVLP